MLHKIEEHLLAITFVVLFILSAGFVEQAPALAFACIVALITIAYLTRDFWADLEEEDI